MFELDLVFESVAIAPADMLLVVFTWYSRLRHILILSAFLRNQLLFYLLILSGVNKLLYQTVAVGTIPKHRETKFKREIINEI